MGKAPSVHYLRSLTAPSPGCLSCYFITVQCSEILGCSHSILATNMTWRGLRDLFLSHDIVMSSVSRATWDGTVENNNNAALAKVWIRLQLGRPPVRWTHTTQHNKQSNSDLECTMCRWEGAEVSMVTKRQGLWKLLTKEATKINHLTVYLYSLCCSQAPYNF